MRTLAAACEVRGVGLHSGALSRVRLLPAPAASGISFVRDDLPDAAPIAARLSRVSTTVLSTTLCAPSAPGVAVSTVEHLMAALCGLGVSSCIVEVDAPELPVLDGSAAPWVAAIRAAGLVPAHNSTSGGDGTVDTMATDGGALRIGEPVCVEDGGSWAVAVPAERAKLTVGIDFPDHPAIGRQWASFTPAADDFGAAVAPARTFALAEQLDAMRERGLIRGGSLENALVCDGRAGWLNASGERLANEPARHKLLDLLGDLALLPGHTLPRCHVVAFRAGHKLHVALGRAIEAASERCRAADDVRTSEAPSR
jgi:UDP-3-O-[3-hydroxymyristoyl] N-acetylglucosamine deacetylase